MRELKFRVWDKEAGEYLEGEEAKAFVLRLDGSHYVEMPFGYYNKGKDWVIEQDTGLKDKNGKRICDGDIIEEDIDFNSDMVDGTFRYSVYWDDSSLCWALDPIGKESIHDELWQTNLSRRVIGNIHKNPELLEKK